MRKHFHRYNGVCNLQQDKREIHTAFHIFLDAKKKNILNFSVLPSTKNGLILQQRPMENFFPTLTIFYVLKKSNVRKLLQYCINKVLCIWIIVNIKKKIFSVTHLPTERRYIIISLGALRVEGISSVARSSSRAGRQAHRKARGIQVLQALSPNGNRFLPLCYLSFTTLVLEQIYELQNGEFVYVEFVQNTL